LTRGSSERSGEWRPYRAGLRLADMCNYTNNLEIRVFGMRRSGNHAVVNWLGAQAHAKPYYFDCAPNDGGDPFRTGKRPGHPEEIWQPVPRLKFAPQEEVERYRKIHKDVLIYTYEDFDLRRLDREEYPHNRERVVGRSRRKVDVFIVRSLLNWVASKLRVRKYEDLTAERFRDNADPSKGHRYCPFFKKFKGWEKDGKEIRGLEFVRMRQWIPFWAEYAKEFLGVRNRLDGDVVVPVYYDRWFVDRDYRKVMIGKIGFAFSDKCLDVVSNKGGGSSFDGLSYGNAAQRMDTLNRWHHFRDNGHFVNLLKHYPEAVALSSLIETGIRCCTR